MNFDSVLSSGFHAISVFAYLIQLNTHGMSDQDDTELFILVINYINVHFSVNGKQNPLKF